LKKIFLSLLLFFLSLTLFSIDKKIVSLTPAITSILIDIGYSDNIVGVTSNDFFLKRTVIGTIININEEKIILLSPDIIIYQDFQEFLVSGLKNILRKKEFIRLNIKDVNSIFNETKKILNYLGKSQRELNRWMDDYKREINKCKNSINKNFKYIFIVDRDPDFKSIFVSGNSSFISEILNSIGGINIIESNRDYIKINQEFLLSLDGVVVFDSSFNKFYNNKLFYEKYLVIDNKNITIPDLRLNEKVKYLCGLLK